jgi:membrane fusion protein (multidrug efflux system)
VVFGALVVAAAVVAAVVYATRVGKEKTDDAQIEAHVSNVSPRIAGQVKHVLVADNQEVKAGDVLIELDDSDQKARLDDAQGRLEEAQSQLQLAQTQLALTGNTAAQIDQAKADIDAAESHVKLAKLERERTEQLRKMGAAPQSDVDARIAADVGAGAALAQSQARLVSALANRSNSSGTETSARGRLLAAQTVDEQVAVAQQQVVLATARVKQAQAAAQLATLQLGYTKVRADIAGVVTKRSVEPGQLVSPDRMLMAIVDLRDTWVVANLKETQLSEIKNGQRAEIEIDAYDGKLTGHVDSTAAGTGARFSLLPPENASGNFIKVTQRVPVKIKIDDRGGRVLRAGMSAEVTIYTR